MSPKIAKLLQGTIDGGGDHFDPNLLQYLDEHLVFFRDHLSAPVATVCKILARFSNSLTSNLIDGIFEHFVMVSLQIKNEIFPLNC